MAKKRRIMIVDDDETLLEEINETLTNAGYETIKVSDSQTAVDIAKIMLPNLILLDLKMAGLNGFQIADRLNYITETAGIPIIAITGFFTKDEHFKLMKTCGIKACMKKPFAGSELLLKIDNFLGCGV